MNRPGHSKAIFKQKQAMQNEESVMEHPGFFTLADGDAEALKDLSCAVIGSGGRSKP